MIVSILSPNGHPTHCIPLPNIIRKIKKGTYKNEVLRIRYYFQHLEWNPFNEAKKLLPNFIPSGHFTKRLSRNNLISFSHCIFLESMPLTEEGQNLARRIIEKENTTLACFRNFTGDRLAFIIKCTADFDQYHLAFQHILAQCESKFQITLNPDMGHPYQAYPLSYDPLAYYNENAEDFPLQLIRINLKTS